MKLTKEKIVEEEHTKKNHAVEEGKIMAMVYDIEKKTQPPPIQ